MSDWHVSNEESLSDHRYICYQIELQVFEILIYRNPKGTDSALIGGILKNIRSRLDLELAADEMQQSILLSCHHNCRTRLADSPKKVSLWSVELSKFRANKIRLFNRAKRLVIGIHIEIPSPNTI